VDENLTGFQNLDMVGRLYHLGRPTARDRAHELLERFELTEAADRTVKTYSGGMRRRLDLAGALVAKPQVLFLDEPTTGLDIQSRTALWDEVARLARQDGVTVFLTTQYLEEADALATRVGIIDHGRIVAEGTPTALKAQIGHPTVEAIPRDPADRDALVRVLERFGSLGDGVPRGASVLLRGDESQLAEIVRELDAERIAIEHLQMHAPSLDDVFLAKTGRSLEGAGKEEEEAEAATGEHEEVPA